MSGINGGIHKIDILLVELFAQQLDSLAEALEMHDLALTEEADDVVHIRVVGKPQDVVVGQAGLLLCRQILDEIGHGVAGDGDAARAPRRAGGRLRIDARRMIGEVGREARFPLLLLRQIPCQLVNDRTDHLQMPKLLRAQRSIGNVPQRKFSSKSCVSWALGT